MTKVWIETDGVWIYDHEEKARGQILRVGPDVIIYLKKIAYCSVLKKTGKIIPHRLTKKNSLLKLINYTLKWKWINPYKILWNNE